MQLVGHVYHRVCSQDALLSNIHACIWKSNKYMQLDLHKLVISPMTGSSILCTNTKTHKYTIKFHCQNKIVLGGLLLLTAFLQPTDNPYEWWGSLMELWWEGRGLCVIAKLRGVEWRSLLSLHYHFSWLPALGCPYWGLFHLFTFIWHFFMNPLPAIWPRPPSINIVELAWYYTISGPTSVKN